MQVPHEFKVFCIPFDPDIFEQDKDEGKYLPDEDVIDFAIRQASDDQKRILQEFLDEVLAAKLSDRELADIWAQGGSRIGFVDDKDYRRVFEKIRRRLA